ncbi:MAG: metal-dependent hydrolase [Candidatus Nanohaloarchaea archaeon]|nr:metal-dependent hydrolase [Candidatus Nanohaloarchaea archaeon]
MLPIAHLLGGFLVLVPFLATGLETTGSLLLLTALLSVFPDIDTAWNETLADHHASLLHTPVFWVAPSLVIAAAGHPHPAYVALAAPLFHLCCDYVTGRSSGVMLFFPLTTDEYALYPIDRSKGDFDPLQPDPEQLVAYLSDYLQSPVQVVFELGVAVLGGSVLLFLL